jgi:hypothetical protein
MGELRIAYNILIGKLVANRPLGRSRRRWEDNETNLNTIGSEDVRWIHLAHDNQMAHCCEHGNEPSGSIKGGEFLDKLSVY